MGCGLSMKSKSLSMSQQDVTSDELPKRRVRVPTANVGNEKSRGIIGFDVDLKKNNQVIPIKSQLFMVEETNSNLEDSPANHPDNQFKRLGQIDLNFLRECSKTEETEENRGEIIEEV